jgi:hypothetical protein
LLREWKRRRTTDSRRPAWGALILVVLAFGPGRLSLDHLLSRKRA